MSGLKPSFLTGANAKIKIGAITIAYAQDVAYRASVSTIPIEIMGRYEVVSHEPVAYSVEGSLSVIRYTSHATTAGAAADGNGVGNWQTTSTDTAESHFNPSKLMQAETFDLEVFQRIGQAASDVLDGPNGGIVRLVDCRFTSKGGSLNRRGILIEQFAFNAILADDDSFNATNSGANIVDLA
jgi:hypothetical protein